MTTREVLEAAKARIDKPQKWCKGSYARAGRRCAVGALQDIAPPLDSPRSMFYLPARAALEHALGVSDEPQAIGTFNDWHTHAEVMALFDQAIEASK